MNAQTPIPRTILDLSLLDKDGQAILTIGTGPQVLDLTLENQSQRDITIGKDNAEIFVSFRPGALQQHTVPEIKTKGWKLTVEGTEFPVYKLTSDKPVTLAPGATKIIKIGNLVPSASGGSRSTRVEVRYDDVMIAGEEQGISGRRIVHLSILHPSVLPGQIAGNTGTTGPFTAQIVSSSDVVIGPELNQVRLEISAKSSTFLTTTPNREETGGNTKFFFSSPAADDTGDAFELMHFNAVDRQGAWEREGHHGIVLNRVKPVEVTKTFLAVTLKIMTNKRPGLYPIYIEYENLDGTDGELAVLVNVTHLGVPGADHDLGNPMVTHRAIVSDQQITAGGLTATRGRLDLGEDWYLAGQRDLFWFESKHKDSNGKNAQLMFLDRGDAFNVTPQNRSKIKINSDFEVTGTAKANRMYVGDNWDFSRGEDRRNTYVSLSHDNTAQLAFGRDKTKGYNFISSYGDNLKLVADKVGLNIDAPKYTLDVKGDVNATSYRIKDGWWIGSHSNATQDWIMFRKKDAGTSAFYFSERKSAKEPVYEFGMNISGKSLNIQSAKNVGIKNRDPKHTLDVKGGIGVTGSIDFGGGWTLGREGTRIIFKYKGAAVFGMTKSGATLNRTGKWSSSIWTAKLPK